jgi:flagellar motor switch/type III secretory pathway protein FliN
MNIPLAQVQSWQRGAVVALDPPPLNEGVEVSIRANGQLIGIGDLVRIDNRVGVRITRLLSKPRQDEQ